MPSSKLRTRRLVAVAAFLLIALGASASSARWRYPLLVLKALLRPSAAHKVEYIFNGDVPATAKGKTAAVLDGKVLLTEGWLVLVKGTFRFAGKLTAKTAGSKLPAKLRFQFLHKDKSGKVLRTFNFDTTVLSDGTIAAQSFNFSPSSFVQIAPGEIVEVTVAPLDRSLPAGALNITAAFQPPAAPFPSRLPERELVTSSTIQQVQLTYAGYLLAAKKGQSFFHIRLDSPKGPVYTLGGTFYMKGQIKDDIRGAALPTKLRVIIKHYDPSGVLLKTDSFNYALQASGTITSKSFAFTVGNTSGLKESLDISVITVDKDMPDTDVNLIIGAKATAN